MNQNLGKKLSLWQDAFLFLQSPVSRNLMDKRLVFLSVQRSYDAACLTFDYRLKTFSPSAEALVCKLQLLYLTISRLRLREYRRIVTSTLSIQVA